MGIIDWFLLASEHFRKVKDDSLLLHHKAEGIEKDIARHESHIEENKKALHEIKSEILRLSTLLEKYDSKKELNENTILSTSLRKKSFSKKFIEFGQVSLSDLTGLEKKCLSIILSMQNESSGDWVHVAEINKELYPNKDEEIMRSTVSNLLSKLETFGLLERIRKGKRHYTKLTNKGEKLLSYNQHARQKLRRTAQIQ